MFDDLLLLLGFMMLVGGIIYVIKMVMDDNKIDKKVKESRDLFVQENQEKYNKLVNDYNKEKEELLKKHGIEVNEYIPFGQHLDNINVVQIDKKGITILLKLKELYKYNVYHFNYDSTDINRDVSNVKYKVYIPLSKLKYYKINGSEREQQIISGGGGGGSSIGGAIVGGMIAGDTGAIIGSRKKVEEIKTTYKKIDDREIELFLEDNTSFKLNYKFYEELLKNMPQKDYDNYISNLKGKGKREE